MAATSAASQPPARPRPLVQVLTFQGCPNREAAEQTRFLGSPTIRVDGHDIQPGADRRQELLPACRLYQGQHSLHPLPEEDWLRQALRTAEAPP